LAGAVDGGGTRRAGRKTEQKDERS
jgi:hypothetical protein